MPADSYNYTSISFDQAEAEVMWTVIKQIGTWLDTTVQSGWSMHDFTGKDKGADTGYFREVLGSVNSTWNPLAEVYNDGNGEQLPSSWYGANNDFSKTVYLRWDDGVGSEQNVNVYDYYLTTLHLYSGVAYNDLRVGCLMTPAKPVFYYGNTANFISYTTINGWGPPPGPGEGPEGLYPYWPAQGSHDLPPAPNYAVLSENPRGFSTQTGYYPGSNRVGNYLTYGSEDICTAHVFAGVDKGAPYLFIIIESFTPDFNGEFHSYYYHCGIGNVVKSGDWKGGQWAAVTYNNGNANYIDSLNSDYNARIFDNITSRYAPSSSRTLIYCSTDGTAFDENDPDSWPKQFAFGDYPTSTTNIAYGCTTGGMLGDIMTQTHHNRANYRTNLLHNYLRLRDPDNSSYFFLAGVTPAQRLAKIRLIQPGNEYTEGGVTWKIFPLRSRPGVPTNTPYSEWYAAAYRMN